MRWTLVAATLITLAILVTGVGTALAQTPPEFRLGFKAIADQTPEMVGPPLENEHFNPANGDSLQRTANGLMVWRKADNWTAFTGGYWTWVNGPNGLQRRLNTDRLPWEADDRRSQDQSPRFEPVSRGEGRSPDSAAQQQFISSVVGPAQASARETGVPASVTIAQAILETGWGQSVLATNGHNYFGIKAAWGPGTAGAITVDTWEVIDGQSVWVKATFRAYHDLTESVMDHGHFLRGRPPYAEAFKTTDPREFARRIQAGGYATDPVNCDKLIAIMDRLDLYQYDLK